jgi:hypothetical protein
MQRGIAFFINMREKEMKKEKSFPWVAVMIFAFFGLLCFIGGILLSNITNKKKLNVAQARLSECENKFLAFSRKVMANTEAAVQISKGVASVWHSSVSSGLNFDEGINEFLEQNKQSISSLKMNNDLIEIQIPELKKYVNESRIEYDTVMQLYEVYKKLYDLGMTPAGTLEGFNSNRDSLVMAYKDVQAKLFVYMPLLQDSMQESAPIETVELPEALTLVKNTEEPMTSSVDPIKPVEKVEPLEQVKSFDKAPEQRPDFDPRIKKIAGTMTYRQVESSLGVPREKKKDSQGREAWIYPSEKAGFCNVVYFDSGKVIQSKTLPLNSALD